MTLVATGKKAGSTARIWIDTQGRLRTRPPTPGKAAAEAGVFGASAALALSGVVSGIGGVGRRYLEGRHGRRLAGCGSGW